MAIALRDAGFQNVDVNLGTIVLDGVYYQAEEDLIQWQRDAIDGEEMNPMTMQLDFEHRSVEFLKTLPRTT